MVIDNKFVPICTTVVQVRFRYDKILLYPDLYIHMMLVTVELFSFSRKFSYNTPLTENYD